MRQLASKADHDWTITISGRGPCHRGLDRDPDQQMLALAEKLEKSGQSIEITDFAAVPLEEHQSEVSELTAENETPPNPAANTIDKPKKRKRK